MTVSTAQREELDRTLERYMAERGLKVLQIERGEYPGSKNVQGAILYSDMLEKIIPMALKKAKPGLLGSEAIKWNFTKFLVGRNGKVLKRFAPNDSPQSLKGDIETALAS